MTVLSMLGPHGAPPLGVTCSARAKSTGKRCRLTAIPGGTVCRRHGGAAPQVQRAARNRLRMAATVVEVSQLGVPGTPLVGERVVAAARAFHRLENK